MNFSQKFDDLIFRFGLQLNNLECYISLSFFTFRLWNTAIRSLPNDLDNLILFFNSFPQIGYHSKFIFLDFLFLFFFHLFLRPLIGSSRPMRCKLWQSLLLNPIFLFFIYLILNLRFNSLFIQLSLQFLSQLLWR